MVGCDIYIVAYTVMNLSNLSSFLGIMMSHHGGMGSDDLNQRYGCDDMGMIGNHPKPDTRARDGNYVG